jgi:hypothetical protein
MVACHTTFRNEHYLTNAHLSVDPPLYISRRDLAEMSLTATQREMRVWYSFTNNAIYNGIGRVIELDSHW